MLISDIIKKNANMGINYINLILNGDFSNGTTGWTAFGAILSAINNTLSMTGNGGSSAPRSMKATSIAVSPTHIYYVTVKARVLNSSCTSLRCFYTGTISGSATIQNIVNPTQNQWYTLSGLYTPTGVSGDIKLELYSYYIDSATANGKVTESQNVMIVDLTDIGHSDKDLAWCVANLPFKP